MKADIDRIEKAAHSFSQAAKEISRVSDKLEKTIQDLDENWQDSGQQKFQLYYYEWVQHTGSFTQLLEQISFELETVADRYKVEDRRSY